MSTDSTELTFVRCPSCRSLVPAVSTRCRMCGATLDASGNAGEEESEGKRSGRVKQRTTSQSPSDMTSIIGQAENEEASGADPLREYLEEGDSNPIEAKDSPPKEAPPAENKPAAAPFAAKPSVSETNGPTRGNGAIGKDAGTGSEKVGISSGASGEAQASQPRVVVESGAKRPGRGGPGLSFGKPREGGESEERGAPGARGGAGGGAPQERRDRGPVESRPERQRPDAAPQQGGAARPLSGDSPRPEREERPRRFDVPPPRQAQPEQRAPREDRPRPNEQDRGERAGEDRGMREARPSSPQPRTTEGVRREEGVRGRLFGWLVSYVESAGRAIELREGKFFITGSSLKPSDIVVQDQSVSTPHALLIVGVNGTLQVQDLMSEQGVFVRRGNSNSYAKEEEVFRVQHGDWIRFGGAEFLVSLLPGNGGK